MFSKLYKKSMDNIKPDELLVQKTKNAMHKELKKKPKTFYKYAAVAACFIITFSLFRTTYKSSNSLNSSIEIDSSSSLDSLDSNKGISNSSSFINSGSSLSTDKSTSNYLPILNIEPATPEALSSSESIFSKFFSWIGIFIRWVGDIFSD